MKNDLEKRTGIPPPVISRRKFVGAAAATGVAGIFSAGLAPISAQLSAMQSKPKSSGGCMPIAYLDVHEGIEIEAKMVLVKGIHDAMQEVYPGGDHRVYVREWPFDSVSQDGQVGWERPRLLDRKSVV